MTIAKRRRTTGAAVQPRTPTVAIKYSPAGEMLKACGDNRAAWQAATTDCSNDSSKMQRNQQNSQSVGLEHHPQQQQQQLEQDPNAMPLMTVATNITTTSSRTTTPTTTIAASSQPATNRLSKTTAATVNTVEAAFTSSPTLARCSPHMTSRNNNNNNNNIPTANRRRSRQRATALSGGATAAIWLLPLLCVVAICVDSSDAGFACLSNPCVFGVCIDGLNSSYSCYCIDGYTGIQCQTNWDECWNGPCQNGGTCVDGVAYYNCTCQDGFSGSNCEENVDECMSNPCQNGGHCRDRNNGYTCTCQPGYLGPHCELDVAVCETGVGARCDNGGECIEGPGLEFSCTCTAGWRGRLCQDEINECESGPCQNGGVCVDKLAAYVCACPMGYSGTNCEEEILICADNPCQNNALCLMEEGVPTCYCVPDYHGEKCEFQYDECQLGPRCMNGGVCIDGVDTFSCSCPPLLTGMLCECLMIGQDSLDCNFTTMSTWSPPVASTIGTATARPAETAPPATTPATARSAETTTAAAAQQPAESGGSTSVEHVGGEDVSSSVGSAEGTTAAAASASAEDGEHTTGAAVSTSVESGSVETSAQPGSGSVEAGPYDEYTTISRFDITGSGSGSHEATTPRPASPAGGPTDDQLSTTSEESAEPGAPSIYPTHPTYTYHVTTIETSVSVEFASPRSTWTPTVPPTIMPTPPDSRAGQPTEPTAESKEGLLPTTTARPMWSEIPTTAVPFFTEYPELHVTTAYHEIELPAGQFTTPQPPYHVMVTTTAAAGYDYDSSSEESGEIVGGDSDEGEIITPTTDKGTHAHEHHHHHHHHHHHEEDDEHDDQHGRTSTAAPPPPGGLAGTTLRPTHTTELPYHHHHHHHYHHHHEHTTATPPATGAQPQPSTIPNAVEITTAPPPSTDDLISAQPPPPPPLVVVAATTTAATETTAMATTEAHSPAATEPTIAYVSPTLPPATAATQPTTTTAAPTTPVDTTPPPPPPTTTTAATTARPLPMTTTTTTLATTTTTVAAASSEEVDGANTVPGVDTAVGPVGGENGSDAADCLKMGCYNGGTCVTTSEGSRCVCRFDRQGALCETEIVVKNAAFSGDSYVSHRIHKDIPNHESLDGVLPMHVQLKVRTRATNGLIMLAAAQGTKGGHYMALFLQKGLLQFQFSCGLQTMLLSELETPVNTGNEISIRAELDFSRNYTHCNASLLVNDTLAMSGDQPTWLKLLPPRLHTTAAILNTWLHLGGAPQAPIGLIIELPPAQSGTGFTGCLHSLRINEETREIFGDALDGFGITECGSLACLSSPCRNGAACIKIETNEVDEHGEKAEKWKCKCPTGYMGPTCEVSVCEDNPCQYGGTCVQFPGSGYLCLCPLGKHGHYCEHNLEVALPSFSGSVNGLSSFVAYTVPIPLEYAIELSFKILPQTMSQIALLAFLGQSGFHDEKSDHLAVSFIQGYIMLTWNLGSGPRRIFTQKPIDFRLDAPRVPYEIKVGRIGRQAWLSVDGKFNITGRSPGSVSRMDVMPILYLGGHEVANFHTLPHDLPLHSGFQGCIYDVQLKAGQVTVPLQDTRGVRGRGVGQCGTRECHRHACQHEGACLQHGATFTCICQEGWYGPLCAQPTNPCDSFNNKCSDDSTCVPLVNGYECDCPVGKTGKNCEEDIRSLSDVSLTGRRSYLAVRWPYLYDGGSGADKLGSKRSQMVNYRNFTKKLMPPKPISSPSQHFVMKLLNEVEKQRSFSPVPLMGAKSFEENHRVQFFFIEFQLRPLSERGLLLYFGTLNSNQDKKIGFVSLSLQGGVVEFRISGPSNHVTVVRSVRMLAIGEWHKIKMAQRGRWLTLWVEGSASSALAPSAEVLVEPDSLLYIGGLKDLSKLPHNAISGFPIPFRGCVRGLVVSGTRIVLNETNILESRNIRDCDGTACGGDSCEAGGHCWLDEKLQPHCICPEYAKGDRCEYSETCKLIPCKNNGRCLRSGRCSCPNGWGGFYCEIAMSKPTTPSFRGNSYLILPPPRIPMKEKRRGPSLYVRPREAIQITLNFSTIEPDGLLLWSEHDRMRFLGLGLENGHLKIASNLLGTNNDTVAAQSSGFIADGAWHMAKVIVDRTRLELQLDGVVIFTEKLTAAAAAAAAAATSSETFGVASTTAATSMGAATPLMTAKARRLSALTARRITINSKNNNSNNNNKDPSITYEDLFYLGGFPKLDSVSERTEGRFNEPFKGCLQDIQFGAEPNTIITDFSTYQGENIGSCDLHGDEPIMLV